MLHTFVRITPRRASSTHDVTYISAQSARDAPAALPLLFAVPPLLLPDGTQAASALAVFALLLLVVVFLARREALVGARAGARPGARAAVVLVLTAVFCDRGSSAQGRGSESGRRELRVMVFAGPRPGM